MPDLNNGLEAHKLATNNFGFSAERIDELEATEYTLATVVMDTSSSTSYFRDGMRKVANSIVKACGKSPRADNLMFRVCEFNSHFSEIHGFKKLSTIKPDDYDSEFNGGGSTALFDATENSVAATQSYGKTLVDNDFQVNGIIFIITDGAENCSKATANSVKKALEDVVQAEVLESLTTILIGLNANDSLDQVLEDFKNSVGINRYISAGDAQNDNTLAKIADFVSKSISSTSSSLGSGGPSQPLVF